MGKSKAAKARKAQRKAAAKSQAAMSAPKALKQKKKKQKQGKSGLRMQPVGPGDNIKSSKKSGLQNFMVSGATTRRAQTICEDEYIGEVIATSTGYANVQYAVNPGQATTFPWGSKIAALYEEYDFSYLEFYYKREVSEHATLGTTGKVILSFDYDASDIAPTTKQQVEDTVPHMDGMPSTPEIRLRLDCARMRKNIAKYVRPGALPANTDIKTYDVGNLNVSTYGLAASSGTLGELRVRYCCKFSEPVLAASQVVGGVAHFSSLVSTTTNNLAGMALQAGYTPTLGGITAAGNTVTFPANIPGNYLLVLAIQAGTSVSAIGFGSFGGGASALNLLSSGNARDAIYSVGSLSGTTTSPAMIMSSCSVTAAGGTVVYNPGTIVTSGTTAGDLWVISLPVSVLTAPEPVQDGEDRVARLEEMVQRLAGLLSPPFAQRSASCVTAEEAEEIKRQDGKTAADSGDELGSSVHIPRGLLSQFMRGSTK